MLLEIPMMLKFMNYIIRLIFKEGKFKVKIVGEFWGGLHFTQMFYFKWNVFSQKQQVSISYHTFYNKYFIKMSPWKLFILTPLNFEFPEILLSVTKDICLLMGAYCLRLFKRHKVVNRLNNPGTRWDSTGFKPLLNWYCF